MATFLYQGNVPSGVEFEADMADKLKAIFIDRFQAVRLDLYAAQGDVDLVLVADLGAGDGSLASSISAVIRHELGLRMISTPLFPLAEFVDGITQSRVRVRVGPQD